MMDILLSNWGIALYLGYLAVMVPLLLGARRTASEDRPELGLADALFLQGMAGRRGWALPRWALRVGLPVWHWHGPVAEGAICCVGRDGWAGAIQGGGR